MNDILTDPLGPIGAVTDSSDQQFRRQSGSQMRRHARQPDPGETELADETAKDQDQEEGKDKDKDEDNDEDSEGPPHQVDSLA